MKRSPKEIRIKLPHIEVAAKQWGNPKGKPVLGIHGWLDNAASFDALAPLLEDCHFIAVDLPGHGLSDHRPKGTVYHIIDYVAEIFDIANALQWDQFSLMGHSMGAAVAGLAASALPEQIDKLVLFDFIGTLPSRIEDSASQLNRHIKALQKRRVSTMPLYNSIEEMVEARLKTGNIFLEEARAIIARNVKQVGDKYSWRSDPRLTVTATVLMPEEQVQVFLGATKCPVMLFLSEATFAHYHPFFSKRIETVPNIETRFLAGNHYLHFNEAKRFAESITQFL